MRCPTAIVLFRDPVWRTVYIGLKLLQTISRTSEGWKQISAVHAGWQSITAGTVRGDALVHDLPGEFNNPGNLLYVACGRRCAMQLGLCLHKQFMPSRSSCDTVSHRSFIFA